MRGKEIMQILADTAYVHTGGTAEELKCAQFLVEKCAALGLKAELEPFGVDMAEIHAAKFLADGAEIPCKGYFNAGSGQIEAPFYYCPNTDPCSLAGCKGKIVMIDGYLGYWLYQDLLENGAAGVVTYSGDVHYADRDIDQRELRSFIAKGRKIPAVNINAKDAVELIRQGAA